MLRWRFIIGIQLMHGGAGSEEEQEMDISYGKSSPDDIRSHFLCRRQELFTAFDTCLQGSKVIRQTG